jgi:outer membrane protein
MKKQAAQALATTMMMALGFTLTGGMMTAKSAMAADDLKIGLVDMQQALQSVDSGKKAKAQLESEFNKRKKEIQSEEASIKKMTEEFKKQSLVMSDEAKAKKQAEIQEKIMKYQELTARSQAEIQQKEQELTRPLITKLRSVIADVAKKKGYNMILEKSDTNVLFSQDKDDLTEEVVKGFNKESKS